MSEFINNYYERLVLERIYEALDGKKMDNDYISDVACVALNQLPAKYVRNTVDTTFYMSPDELSELNYRIHGVVASALKYVDQRRHLPPNGQASKGAKKLT